MKDRLKVKQEASKREQEFESKTDDEKQVDVAVRPLRKTEEYIKNLLEEAEPTDHPFIVSMQIGDCQGGDAFVAREVMKQEDASKKSLLTFMLFLNLVAA